MKQRMLLFIFVLQAFIFNLTNVITPQYLSDLNLERYSFGYFTALWSLGMLVSSPVWGELGDRYGRKKLIVLGLLIYSMAQLGFYYTNSIPVLFGLRIVSGIGVGAPVTLLLSYLITTVKKEQRAKYLSLRMGFLTLGSTISYKVSGYLGLTFTKELFLAQSVLTIIFVLCIIFGIKEHKDPHCVFPKQFHLFNSFKHVKLLNANITIFLFSITLTTMTFINIDKFIDIFVIDSGYDSSVLGNLKMVIGLTLIITNVFLVPKLKKYLGRVYILQTMQVLMSIIVLIVFINNNILLMLYSVFLLYVVLKAVFTTSEQLYLSNRVKKEDLGLFIGLRQSFTCLGMILGPIIGGYIYQSSAINLFVFNVICLLISSLLLSYIRVAPQPFEQLNYSG